MRRIGLISLAAFSGFFLLAAVDARRTIHLPTQGFSIAPLETPGDADGVLMTMSLAATDGFAPNVNVLGQKSPGTLDDYITISRQEVEKIGLTIVEIKKVDENTVTFQYAGKMMERSLHWYSKASLKGQRIILVTATATEDQWAKHSKQLENCVDSFQRDSDK